MRRFIKITLAFIGLVIGLPLVCLAVVVAGANTGIGRLTDLFP